MKLALFLVLFGLNSCTSGGSAPKNWQEEETQYYMNSSQPQNRQFPMNNIPQQNQFQQNQQQIMSEQQKMIEEQKRNAGKLKGEIDDYNYKTYGFAGHNLMTGNELPDGPPIFQRGWKDGCKTGLDTSTSMIAKVMNSASYDAELMKDAVYRSAFNTAMLVCITDENYLRAKTPLFKLHTPLDAKSIFR